MRTVSRRRMVLGLVAASVALPSLRVTSAAAQTGPSDGPLVITEYISYKPRLTQYLNVVGTIENPGVEAHGLKTIAVSLLDGQGQTVGAESAVYKPTKLEPGERSGWLAVFSDVPEFTEIRLQVETGPAHGRFGPQLAQGLSFEGITAQQRRSSFASKITGQVVNTGSQTVGRAKVIGAVYAPTGELVEVNQGYAKLAKLGPGQSTPFDIDFLRNESADPSSYELYVEGWTEQ